MSHHATSCEAVPLFHLGMLHAEGEEADTFLYRLLSNDKLSGDAVQWTSFNSAQGRMLANFLMWRDGAGFRLALSADLVTATLEKLSRYILRTKVKLSLSRREQIGLVGALSGDVLARAAWPVPSANMQQASSGGKSALRINPRMFIIDLPSSEVAATLDALYQSGATAGDVSSWQLASIRNGLPLVTAATQEAFVAQMLNFELIGGVSFTKGCYPGQEVIARTQHLGKPKRRLFRIGLLSPAENVSAGTPVHTDSGQPAGDVLNFVPLPDGGEALAVLRLEHVDHPLYIGAAPIQVFDPFFPYD